jgi:hypothetical protein
MEHKQIDEIYRIGSVAYESMGKSDWCSQKKQSILVFRDGQRKPECQLYVERNSDPQVFCVSMHGVGASRHAGM